MPERVLIYIAQGYQRPNYQVGKEEYVWVEKGMMAQRILPYDEIDSDCILLLDDDVLLAPDSAEKMLNALKDNNADCIGADVFKNHEMRFGKKVLAAVSNLVFPHWSAKWAFKMHRNGSFSYNNHPTRSFYWSQTCGGPAMLWKKEAFVRLELKDESWLEQFGFAYNDDDLESYKLYCNGGHLGVLFNSGIDNLDARTTSDIFRKSSDWMYRRTKASLMIWWRTCYRHGQDSFGSRTLAAISYGIKTIWLIPVVVISAVTSRRYRWVLDYFNGVKDGISACKSLTFMSLPPYIFNGKR